MNDDAAEKASRRKSAHFGDLGVSRKDKEGEGEKDKGKRTASGAMAVQNSLNSSLTRDKVRKRLSAVGVAAGLPAPVALEVNSTKFEEWMKLATDNVGLIHRCEARMTNEQKITATNTWNFALIDYFADLTLLRNDEDQSQLDGRMR